MGVKASLALELPTKLLFTWSKVIGAETSAAAASEDPTGEVALSVAHEIITTAAPARQRKLIGLCMVSLQE
ncbi:MAG: hypothetical protein DMD39_01390 [Gemmatimonadetes bacterium]|nr:MAG: hypothetical protein DMD39_01390 [Gemmatimonadota bacterium]